MCQLFCTSLLLKLVLALVISLISRGFEKNLLIVNFVLELTIPFLRCVFGHR